MSAQDFEAFLASIYVDAAVRARFRTDPRAEARRAGLSAEECTALEQMDWTGLELAARSFAHKRAQKQGASWWRKIHAWHSPLRRPGLRMIFRRSKGD